MEEWKHFLQAEESSPDTARSIVESALSPAALAILFPHAEELPKQKEQEKETDLGSFLSIAVPSGKVFQLSYSRSYQEARSIAPSSLQSLFALLPFPPADPDSFFPPRIASTPEQTRGKEKEERGRPDDWIETYQEKKRAHLLEIEANAVMGLDWETWERLVEQGTQTTASFFLETVLLDVLEHVSPSGFSERDRKALERVVEKAVAASPLCNYDVQTFARKVEAKAMGLVQGDNEVRNREAAHLERVIAQTFHRYRKQPGL